MDGQRERLVFLEHSVLGGQHLDSSDRFGYKIPTLNPKCQCCIIMGDVILTRRRGFTTGPELDRCLLVQVLEGRINVQVPGYLFALPSRVLAAFFYS